MATSDQLSVNDYVSLFDRGMYIIKELNNDGKEVELMGICDDPNKLVEFKSAHAPYVKKLVFGNISYTYKNLNLTINKTFGKNIIINVSKNNCVAAFINKEFKFIRISTIENGDIIGCYLSGDDCSKFLRISGKDHSTLESMQLKNCSLIPKSTVDCEIDLQFAEFKLDCCNNLDQKIALLTKEKNLLLEKYTSLKLERETSMKNLDKKFDDLKGSKDPDVFAKIGIENLTRIKDAINGGVIPMDDNLMDYLDKIQLQKQRKGGRTREKKKLINHRRRGITRKRRIH